jgi:hypothetical protein
MDATEIRQTEQALREVLLATGYAWVVEQVDAVAAEPRDGAETPMKGEPVKVPSDTAYGRLTALVDAMRFAMEEGMRLRRAVRERLVDEDATSLRIVDESGDGVVRVTLDTAASPDDAALRELAGLFDQLREAIDEPSR